MKFSLPVLHAFMLALLVTVGFSVVRPKARAEADRAAPHFVKKKAKLDRTPIVVEVADSPEKLQYGLMYRRSLPENQGMLFIFGDEQIRRFWMKNTIMDLSIGFFDGKKILIDVQEMQATSMMDQDPPVYVSKGAAKYALEMPKGWFKSHGIKNGAKISF
jgi:uncharacterized membrane protein (UPF0127 family)